MTPQEIFKKNLSPLNKSDEPKWDEFIQSIDDTILWFPEGGTRFHMLNWFTSEDVEEYPNPSLCIYTDHLPTGRLNEFINGGTLEYEGHKVIVNDVVPLKVDWDYTLNYNLIHPLHKSVMSVLYEDEKYGFVQSEPTSASEKVLIGRSDDQYLQDNEVHSYKDLIEKVCLLKITAEFEHETLDEPETSSFETYILYFFHEQVAFFKKFILEEGLKIKYLVSLKRENRPLLTGRVFEHLLGYMGAEFLITRFEKTRAQINEIFLSDPEIAPLIKHKRNRRYLLEEVVSYAFFNTIFKVKYNS